MPLTERLNSSKEPWAVCTMVPTSTVKLASGTDEPLSPNSGNRPNALGSSMSDIDSFSDDDESSSVSFGSLKQNRLSIPDCLAPEI